MTRDCRCGGIGVYKVVGEALQRITCNRCGVSVESSKLVPVWDGWIKLQAIARI